MPGSTPSQDNGLSYLYMLAAFVVVVAGMRAAEPILNPLLLSIFLAVVSSPVYFALLRRGVAEWLSLLIVICGLTVLLLVLLFFVVGSISSFTSQQARYRQLISQRKQDVQAMVEGWFPEWDFEFGKGGAAVETAPPQDPAGGPEDAREAGEDGEDGEDGRGSGETDSTVPGSSSAPGTSSAAGADEEPDETAGGEQARADEATGTDREPAAATEGSSADEAPGVPGPEVAEDIPQDPLDEVVVAEDEFMPPSPEEAFRAPEDAVVPEQQPRTWREMIYSQFDPGTVLATVVSITGSVAQLLSKGFLILLTVIFILLEVRSFPQKMKDAFGQTDDVAIRAAQIVSSIQRYLALKTVMSLLTGILIAGWLTLFRIPYAGLWGLVAFLLNYIPNVGSVVAAVPAVLIAWLEFGMLSAVGAATGYLLVNMIVGNFLEPRLMGRRLGLSTLVVFCSMVFWGWVLGPIGMLLSVPLTMTVRIALEGFEDTRWIALLMGNSDNAVS